MRLFRKSKAGQGSAGADASNLPEAHHPPQAEQPEASPLPLPQPPPVLQLNFELPSVPPSTLALNATTTGMPNGNDISSQQQQYGVGGATHAQEFQATASMGDNAEGGLLHQGLMAPDMQRIAAAYSFDYPFQLGEESSQSQTEEESVQRQLAEQFGFGPKAHRTIPQPQHPPSQSNVGYNMNMPQQAPSAPASHVASRSSPSLAPSQKHQQLARVVMHNMQMATANRTTFSSAPIHQMSMSHSSGGSSASSEDECGMPKLSNSMTAMSLSGGAPPATSSVGKLSDRAQHIQKVREASTLGKVVAFSKPAYSTGGTAVSGVECDEDDEDDLVPLGGLRRAVNNSLPNITAVDRNGVQTNMMSQQAATHGHMFPGSVPFDNGASMAKHGVSQHALSMHNLQQQQLNYHYQQHQQAMLSPSTASVTSQMSAPMVMRRATVQRPGPSTDPNQHMYPGSPSQQMAYPRTKTVAGGIGSAYSHVGYSRTPGVPDPSSHAYTPSPLGQVPIYNQPAIAAYQQMPPADMHMVHYPPAMMSHAALPMASQQMYPQRAQPYQFPQQPPPQQQFPPQQFPPQQYPPPQPQQLPSQQPQVAVQQHHQAPVGQHPAALTSFIPSQLACRGSLAKNPLMRDINKLKSFSAKDYTTRPTLLAEADSRQLAKKNMPGLGGATSHSYQPEVPPPIQQQPPPPLPEPQHQQHQTFRPHDQGDYRDQADHHPRSNRYEAPHHSRSRSCQVYDDEDNDYSSVSSRTSGRRHTSARRNGDHGPTRRHRYDHADNTYGSEYGERPRHRESRQMAPPPSSHSRRALEQRRQPRRNDRYHEHYEHYDYEDRSERYARDYYDDYDNDEEFDERYGDRYDHQQAGPGFARRRDAQGRTRTSDMRMGRARAEAVWASPYGSRGSMPGRHGHYGRPRLVRLDDPRDADSIIIRSSPPHTSKAGSSDSESLLVLEHGKPRSQFGRILANLKRQTAGFAPVSPKATVHSVQIRGSKVAGAHRAADGRIVEMKSEIEDNDDVVNVKASAVPEGAIASTPPTESMEQDASEQPLQTVETTDAVEDNGSTDEAPSPPPTPIAVSAVPVAAT